MQGYVLLKYFRTALEISSQYDIQTLLLVSTPIIFALNAINLLSLWTLNETLKLLIT